MRVPCDHCEGENLDWCADCDYDRLSNKSVEDDKRIAELEAMRCAHATGKHDQECDLVAGLSAENAKLRALFEKIREWASTYGRALCPPHADTYGEGVRDCKEQVSHILAALHASRKGE